MSYEYSPKGSFLLNVLDQVKVMILLTGLISISFTLIGCAEEEATLSSSSPNDSGLANGDDDVKDPDHDMEVFNSEPDCHLNAEERVGIGTVCLDQIDFVTEWCDREGEIEELLNQASSHDSEKSVSCSDVDGDCSYSCTDWILPDVLEDPDDRRSTITGDLEAREALADVMLADEDRAQSELIPDMSTTPELQSSTVLPSPSDPLTCMDTLEDGRAIEGSVCLYYTGEDRPERVWACENNGVAWISRVNGRLVLVLNHLIDGDHDFWRTEIPIDFIPGEVACHRDWVRGTWSVMTTDLEQSMIYRNIEGQFEPYNLLSAVGELYAGLDMPFDLRSASISSVQDLSVDANGFQSWGIDLDSLNHESSASPVFGMRIEREAPQYYTGRAEVINQRFSCNGCVSGNLMPRRAELLANLSVVVSEGEGDTREEVTLFEDYGPFKTIDSSESLLILGNEEEGNERLYFSLWTESLSDEDSLINFPLTFEALERGYERVDLIDVNGLNVLLLLTENADESAEDQSMKGVYAVYNALTENFIVLNDFLSADKLAALLGRVDLDTKELKFNRPLLHTTWVSRVVQVDEENFMMVLKLTP